MTLHSSPAAPVVAVRIVRHPANPTASAIETAIHAHLVSTPLTDAAGGGSGVQVVSHTVPGHITLDGTAVVAIVVLVDPELAKDRDRIAEIERFADACEAHGRHCRVFPVSLYDDAYKASERLGRLNFLRWHDWPGDDTARQASLLRELTLGCCRMLRAWLETRRKLYDRCADPVAAYEAPVTVFLSHSKRDTGGVGESMARDLRNLLHGLPGQGSFFDAYDIPAGLDFGEKIEREAARGVFVAVVSDSYADREWCRREAIAARTHHVPMVVIDALSDRASRSLSYLGNVPVIRVEPGKLADRLPIVLTAVLDQLLRRLLFQALVMRRHQKPVTRKTKQPQPPAGVSFHWRLPDLMDLHTLGSVRATIAKPWLLVHPGSPLATEERDMFKRAAPKVRVLSYTSWLAQTAPSGIQVNALTVSGKARTLDLGGRTIALSIADSPDLATLGLTGQHLRDAFADLVAHLLEAGAHLIYGGDLRRDGYTELLTGIVARYAKNQAEAATLVTNPLAWPVHLSKSWEHLHDNDRRLTGVARQQLLNLEGAEIALESRRTQPTREPTRDEWHDGLTNMRHAIAQRADAVIVLGGKLADFHGRMPGTAEEAIEAVKAGKPVYLLGGYGGATRAMCQTMGLLDPVDPNPLPPEVTQTMSNWTVADSLRNGLDEAEAKQLADSRLQDEVTALVLRGLGRSFNGN